MLQCTNVYRCNVQSRYMRSWRLPTRRPSSTHSPFECKIRFGLKYFKWEVATYVPHARNLSSSFFSTRSGPSFLARRLAGIESSIKNKIRHFGCTEFRHRRHRYACDVVVVTPDPTVISRVEHVHRVVATDRTSSNVVHDWCQRKHDMV